MAMTENQTGPPQATAAHARARAARLLGQLRRSVLFKITAAGYPDDAAFQRACQAAADLLRRYRISCVVAYEDTGGRSGIGGPCWVSVNRKSKLFSQSEPTTGGVFGISSVRLMSALAVVQ